MWFQTAMSNVDEINGTGTLFVAAILPKSVRKVFDHIKDLDKDLHMTILYVPNGIDNSEQRYKILNSIKSVCDKTAPLKCQFTAISIMGNKENSLVANIDCIDLSDFYTNIIYTIENKTKNTIDRTHGLLPHVTLKINGDSNIANIKDLRKFKWTVDEITVSFGDNNRFKRYIFKLKGDK